MHLNHEPHGRRAEIHDVASGQRHLTPKLHVHGAPTKVAPPGRERLPARIDWRGRKRAPSREARHDADAGGESRSTDHHRASQLRQAERSRAGVRRVHSTHGRQRRSCERHVCLPLPRAARARRQGRQFFSETLQRRARAGVGGRSAARRPRRGRAPTGGGSSGEKGFELLVPLRVRLIGLPPPSSARPFGAARFLPPPNAVLAAAAAAARGVEGGRRVDPRRRSRRDSRGMDESRSPSAPASGRASRAGARRAPRASRSAGYVGGASRPSHPEETRYGYAGRGALRESGPAGLPFRGAPSISRFQIRGLNANIDFACARRVA